MFWNIWDGFRSSTYCVNGAACCSRMASCASPCWIFFGLCRDLLRGKAERRSLGAVGLVCGGQRDDTDCHRMIFDAPMLSGLLFQAGFSGVRKWDWRKTDHVDIDDYSPSHLPHMDKESGRLMSLNLEAVK